MDKNKIISKALYILGALGIGSGYYGSGYMPGDTMVDGISSSGDLGGYSSYSLVAGVISMAAGVFFTWRAKKQYQDALNKQTEAMQQYQQQIPQPANQQIKK